jgi:hypothetical protein
MEKIDIVLWVISGGFALMLIMWHNLNSRIEHVENSLGTRIDKLDEKVTDIDRRLCRLEGAFSSKAV